MFYLEILSIMGDKNESTNGYLAERYEKYEIEEEWGSKIKSLECENKRLKKEVKMVRKQNDNFKSSKHISYGNFMIMRTTKKIAKSPKPKTLMISMWL